MVACLPAIRLPSSIAPAMKCIDSIFDGTRPACPRSRRDARPYRKIHIFHCRFYSVRFPHYMQANSWLPRRGLFPLSGVTARVTLVMPRDGKMVPVPLFSLSSKRGWKPTLGREKGAVRRSQEAARPKPVGSRRHGRLRPAPCPRACDRARLRPPVRPRGRFRPRAAPRDPPAACLRKVSTLHVG